jgi:hypothetical protein
MSDPTSAARAPQTPVPANAPVDLTHVNYEALTAPITSAQVRAFRAQVKAAQRADPSIRTGLSTATSIFSIVFLVMFVGVFLVTFVFALVAGLLASDGGEGFAAVFPLIFMLVFIAIAVFVVVRHFGSGCSWSRWMRLSRFAADNGLEFRTASPNPSYSGMIFDLGYGRATSNHLNSVTGRYFDLGDYQYTTGSGRSRTTHYWGFLALKLDRELPNMVLDSKENNSLFGSDLPIHLDRDQILSLEGDFDKHFTLYCPKEYEQDALYVFTPDLMALLIDDAGSFDVEIVDDWMFIYSPHRFPPLSQPNYARLFTIVQTVGNKTISQTANYHDDRVGSMSANFVAPQGQRLRHGTSIGALIIGGLFAAFWLFSVFHGFN